MCFQHRFETFQRQFRNSDVPGQWVPDNRSGDTETPGPEATGPGSRHSQVAPCSRPQMRSGVNLPDRIAGAAEVSRASTMYGVANKDSDLEFDPLTNGKPVELVPQHRSDMVWDTSTVDLENSYWINMGGPRAHSLKKPLLAMLIGNQQDFALEPGPKVDNWVGHPYNIVA